jgi:hypothetical protein
MSSNVIIAENTYSGKSHRTRLLKGRPAGICGTPSSPVLVCPGQLGLVGWPMPDPDLKELTAHTARRGPARTQSGQPESSLKPSVRARRRLLRSRLAPLRAARPRTGGWIPRASTEIVVGARLPRSTPAVGTHDASSCVVPPAWRSSRRWDGMHAGTYK